MTDMAPVRWWHYTTADRFRQIVDSASIRRASSHVKGRERRAVWFTCRETWEPTATKAVRFEDGREHLMAIPEMVARAGSLVRLEVSDAVARHTWAHHRRVGGIDPSVADGLEGVARRDGSNPNDWRVSYQDVQSDQIISVDVSTDGVNWQLFVDVVDGQWVQNPEFVLPKGGA